MRRDPTDSAVGWVIVAIVIFAFALVCIAVTVPTTPVVDNIVGRTGPQPLVIPNHLVTPGTTNPKVTQANINQTICSSHWSTKSIRPASSYTTKLKRQQLASMGYADQNLADYEEDHLISLELGGNPTDPKNLWPESYRTTPNARDKDQVENCLHKEICDGDMTLAEAQQAIASDWQTACSVE